MARLPFWLRVIIFTAGLLTSSLGIALVTNADLGTTPITSIPLALHAILPLSVGGYTAILNTSLVGLQALVLGKYFRWTALYQIPPMLVFSAAIDFWLHVTASVSGLPYIERFCFLMLGICTLAAGIQTMVSCNVTVMPGEGIVIAVAFRFGHSFGSMKVLIDCSMVASAAIMAFIFLGTVVGIREGTLLSAVLTGFVVRFYNWVGRGFTYRRLRKIRSHRQH